MSLTAGSSAVAGPPVAAADEIFLQEMGRQIPSPTPLDAVAVFDGQVFAGTKDGLLRLQGDELAPGADVKQPITRLVAAKQALWALSSAGLFRLQAGHWKQISDQATDDVTEHLGEIVVASNRKFWKVEGDKLVALGSEECKFPIARVISHCETLYAQGGARLTYWNGRGFGGLDAYGFSVDQAVDFGKLPSTTVRDALSQQSRLYLATDRGLGVLRGMALSQVRGPEGLPYEDATCLAAGFGGDLWIGTSRGAIRQTASGCHYFAGRRWLPHDAVRAIATSGHTVYVATQGGLGIIDYVPLTLEEKAKFYELALVAWGQKRLGLVHKLEFDDPLGEYVREAGDNDGGYTGNYLGAQSYRYAVTKDPAARAAAIDTFQALRWLEAITGIPGYPARSVWAKGERGHKANHGSGGLPAEWHDTKDGKFEWKGDTSSDELCSHFYSIMLFLEHVAEGKEKEQAREYLAKVAAHLIEHQWTLVDVDGKPTRWGRWDPEYFKTDEGRYDRGLQCLEILSFMKVAGAVSGDPKFEAAYQQLVGLGYPTFAVRQRNTFPPEDVLHFLDEMALWCYSNLLRHERDPLLRSTYRRSLERSYEVIRMEQNPWFNFVYGAITGNEIELEPAVRHLRDWPTDLRVWSYQNSHRADLHTPPGYTPYKSSPRTFSPRETEPLRWDHWLMQADGGTGGRDVVEPSAWLLAYWMGRSQGYIAEPTAEARAQATPAAQLIERLKINGAKPYEGPQRPAEYRFER
ncbi:MAG: hypothetical protein U0836_26135 [Pirellulales bacterium]